MLHVWDKGASTEDDDMTANNTVQVRLTAIANEVFRGQPSGYGKFDDFLRQLKSDFPGGIAVFAGREGETYSVSSLDGERALYRLPKSCFAFGTDFSAA